MAKPWEDEGSHRLFRQAQTGVSCCMSRIEGGPVRPLILPLASRSGPSFSHRGRRENHRAIRSIVRQP